MPSRPERLAHMAAEFERLGVGFSPFVAVDPASDPDNPRWQTLPARRDKRPWLKSEIGCLMSHHALWREAADRPEDCLAIFEDDVVLSDQLAGILHGNFPADADIIKLDTNYQILYLGRRLIAGKADVGFRRLLSAADGSGAYIISRSAARKVAAALDQFDFPIDTILFSPKLARRLALTVYQAVPAVAVQGVFVEHLKGSAVMTSDREVEHSAQGPAQKPSLGPQLLFRMIRRAWSHVRGRRQKVAFSGD
jgi:glycosyl transferase family 25